MLRKIKHLSISSIAILLVLVVFGAIAFSRTVRKDIIQIKSSEEGLTSSVKSAALSFSGDYEQLIPHERRMNTLLYYATGIFNSNHVIWGKDDWLFYSSKNNGDPIADYEGTNSYSPEELEQAKNNMLNVQDSLQDKGIDFCLLIPPNKENVYAQYMPDKYHHTEKTRTDTLTEYLSASGVNCINPKEALLQCDDKYRTYYKLDTHWNKLGAYIGLKETLELFNIRLPELSDSIIEAGDSTVSDLADMVGLTSVFPKDYGFTVSIEKEKDTENEITKEEMGSMTHYHNEKALQDSSVLLIGDSFREAMIPFCKRLFTDFYVVQRGNYQKLMLDEVIPDYVILEMVERLSESTKDFAV